MREVSAGPTIHRNGPGLRPLRYLRRLAALVGLAAAALALWLVLSPVLPSRYAWSPFTSASGAPAAKAAAPKAPPRPAGIPARIPGWAWKLHEWLLAGHGTRPAAAPSHVPQWFWTWRKWRLQVERH